MQMKQREFDVDKNANFHEWYNSIIYAADLADIRYNVRGFVIYRPWAMHAFKKLYQFMEAELEEDGHEPVLFPTVIPEENFKKEAAHVEGFAPEVLWVTNAGGKKLEKPLALRPTSETAFYHMYKLWLENYKQLPYKLYQSCSVFRFEDETNPFLRGIEFLWIETHDLFATMQDSRDQVLKDGEMMRAVMTGMLGVEFLQFERPQWDKFAGAESTFAYDTLMPDGKVLQFGSTHLLGQNFSKAFDTQYVDEKGGKSLPYTTCFGPGMSRMLAAVFIVHGDSKGLVFPYELAPVQVVIIPISRDEAEMKQLQAKATELKKSLRLKGVRAEVDFSEKTPGFKYNHWEMHGVPFRIELGKRELDEKKLTLARRDNREKIQIAETELHSKLVELSKSMLESMREKSRQFLHSSLKDAASTQDVLSVLDSKGIARTSFCSVGMDGKACADKLKTFTKGGKVRGTLVGIHKAPSGKCVVCGKPAGVEVYVARQY